MKDLLLLVADKNAQFALNGALQRHRALGIRPIEFDFRVHPGRDGGNRKTGPEILNLEARRFHHAFLVLDLEGSGTECSDATSLEEQMDRRLEVAWQGRSKSIVIDPEADAWLWGSENVMQQVLCWPHPNGIRSWLKDNGFEFSEGGKPLRPKEAFEKVVRKCKLPHSSSLYNEITAQLSLSRCIDPAFLRLSKKLLEWFPAANSD